MKRSLTRVWTKALACTGGDCVEVLHHEGFVLVRDSKHAGLFESSPGERPVIVFTLWRWSQLLEELRTSGQASGTLERQVGGDVVVRSDSVGLRFTSAEWDAFEEEVRSGGFDFDPLYRWGRASSLAEEAVRSIGVQRRKSGEA